MRKVFTKKIKSHCLYQKRHKIFPRNLVSVRLDLNYVYYNGEKKNNLCQFSCQQFFIMSVSAYLLKVVSVNVHLFAFVSFNDYFHIVFRYNKLLYPIPWVADIIIPSKT